MLNISLGASWLFDTPQLSTPFLIGLFDCLESNFLSSLYIFNISPVSDIGLVTFFSQFVDCHIVLLTEACNFMMSHMPVLDLKA